MHKRFDRPRQAAGHSGSGLAVLAFLLISLVCAGPVAAHGPTVLPLKLGGEVHILPSASRQAHLSFGPAMLDFGDVIVGASPSLSLTVTNDSKRTVTVAISAPSDVTTAPSTLALAPGATSAVTVTWSPTQAGPLAEELVFAVIHDGVKVVLEEPVSVLGNAGAAAQLRFDVTTFGETDVDGTDFGLASVADASPDRAPGFEVTITNVGGLPARDVDIEVPGPGGIFQNLGRCFEGLDEAGICVAELLGTDGEGKPIITTSTRFDEIAPGAAVRTWWRVVPAHAGLVDRAFDVRFETGGEATPRARTFTVAGEILGSSIPGGGFLKAGEGGTGMEGFGASVDPLEDDVLGTLRPVSFDARTVFSLGEVDTVDLRTGNLTLLVPIGGPQAVRGSLAYELKAVLNGNMWHRRTMTEYVHEGPRGAPKGRPKNAEYPDPAFNLGSGWSLHLGRLLPPFVFDGIGINPNVSPSCPADALGFEKHVETSDRFVYIDPNGTQHHFWRQLHGSEHPTGEPGTLYTEKQTLFTRDGSYLRLVLDPNDPDRRWVEEPSGIKRVFVKQPEGVREPTLPDEWLLESIEDPYGNKVTIEYGTVTVAAAGGGTRTALGWRIRDHQGDNDEAWRTVRVAFRSWAGQSARDPMVVEQVDLPGFAGGLPRSYRFSYTDVTLSRPPRSDFHSGLPSVCPNVADPTIVQASRLDSITLPDGSAYTFDYEATAEDPQRLQWARLPTGAKIEYEYALVWDSPPDCENPSRAKHVPGISRRTVKGKGDAVLEDRRFLRETVRTADVPDTICQAFRPGDSSSNKAPFSEQTVAVWAALETGQSSVSVHHFNIYPFDDRCSKLDGGVETPLGDGTICHRPEGATRWRLNSGRTHIERNLKISHSNPNEEDPSLKLSEELYSCDVSLGGITVPRDELPTGPAVGDDISVLTEHASCSKKETTYAAYEVSRAGLLCQSSSPSCLLDSRLKASRRVFHTDENRWINTFNDDFDGLGHYRKTTIRSDFDPDAPNGRLEQTKYQRWNPGVGTLTLNADHTVATNITAPATWLLGTWDYQWVDEGGARRGGEAHFDAARGHLTHERTWAKTALTTIPGQIGTNRSADDVVVANGVNASGELETQRFFGADLFNVPVGGGWFNDTALAEANQEYAVEHTYAFGQLATKRVAGDSVYEVRRTVDQGTGWPLTETRNSGEVITFDYDAMGRLTWATSDVTASRNFDYSQQPDLRWNLTATVYPKGTTATTAAPEPIRRYDAAYDALGRLRSETLPRYNDDPGDPANRQTVTRTVAYHPAGTIQSVTPLDPGGQPSRFGYDYRGRVTTITHPDGSKQSRIYAGDRKTFLNACVHAPGATATNGTSLMGLGICPANLAKAETVIFRDFKGRVTTVEAPLDNAISGGFFTKFTYDPLGNRTSAKRTHTEDGVKTTQNRFWTYDGRGFLTRETIPERTATEFRKFNTRGLPETQAELGRTSTLTYDRLGRLRALVQGGLSLKRFNYCDPAAAVDPDGPGPEKPLCSTEGPENGQLIKAIRNNYRAAEESGVGSAATWIVEADFRYDAAGRQSGRDTSVYWGAGWFDNPTPASAITTFTQTWAHDDLGNVTSLGYPTCNTASQDCSKGRTVDYTFGQGFFLTGAADATAASIGATLTYHPSGLVNTVAHAGGGGSDIYGVIAGMPRIASIDLGVGATAGGQRFNLGSVSYDWAGNIKSIGTEAFTYDLNSRLATATVEGTSRSYTYDNFDNLRNEDNPVVQERTGTVDAETNQLTGTGWTYDAYGNLLTGSGHQMVYDGLDKLAGLHEPSGASLLGIYDHEDLRLLTWRENDPQNGEKTWTLRDGLRVIREYVGLGSAIQIKKDYVYAGARLLTSEDGISGDVRHYHEDQVGNARLTTGANPGRVHYEPFGEALGGTASGERTVGFQGHENDGLTTYMRGRTYLPFAHRFLQVDPARDSGSWSQYAFVGNNPMRRIDPTGKAGLIVSVSGKIGAGPAGRFEVGLVVDHHGNVGWTVSSGAGIGGGRSVGAGIGFFTHDNVNDIAGPSFFGNIEGFVGPAVDVDVSLGTDPETGRMTATDAVVQMGVGSSPFAAVGFQGTTVPGSMNLPETVVETVEQAATDMELAGAEQFLDAYERYEGMDPALDAEIQSARQTIQFLSEPPLQPE